MILVAALALSTHPISLPPTLLTFGDLCGEISKCGTTVKCGDAIRERIAVVALHERSLEETEKICAAALGVAFGVQADGTIQMDLDPAVKLRRRRELDRYVAKVDGHARAVFARAGAIAKSVPSPTAEDLQALAISSHERQDDITATAATYLCCSPPYQPRDLRAVPGAVATAIWHDFIQSGGGISRLMTSDRVVNEARPAGVQRLGFDPVDGSVYFERDFADPMILPPRDPNDLDPWSRPGTPYGRSYLPLGAELAPASLVAWLRSRGNVVGSTASSALSEKMDLGKERRSVATLLARWALHTNQDVMMEVSSVRDRVYSLPGEIYDLSSVLWPPTKDANLVEVALRTMLEGVPREFRGEGGANDGFRITFAPGFPLEISEFRHAEMWPKLQPWRVAEVAGAMVLSNDLAFLDERYPSGAPLLPVGGLTAPSEGPLLDMSLREFVTACRGIDRKTDTRLARLDVPWANQGLIRAIPFGRALAQMEPTALASALDEFDRKGEVIVKMPPSAISLFCESIRSHALATREVKRLRPDCDALVATPDFQRAIGFSTLHISWMRDEASPYLRLSFERQAPQGTWESVIAVRLDAGPDR